jgi:ABC-type multidrug transport system ATPase subunit
VLLPSMTSEPLLVCEDLRLDVEGVPVCDGLTARTTGERVLVLGAPRALFEATCGLRPVVRGALRICGTDASDAVRKGVVAGARLDPPLPPKWTVLEYVTWSSRLAGHSRGDARRLATEAVELTQLGPMAETPLARLVGHAKRGVVLAGTLATDADVIVLEDPLAALPEEHARSWARVVVRALASRAWLVLAGRVSLTSPLAMEADEALVVSASSLDAQGPPAEIAAARTRFVARIHGPLEALGVRLAEKGARMEIQGAQVLLDLGEGVSTSDLLRIAAEVEATVVELAPVARALA